MVLLADQPFDELLQHHQTKVMALRGRIVGRESYPLQKALSGICISVARYCWSIRVCVQPMGKSAST